jgi:hypothetical protein
LSDAELADLRHVGLGLVELGDEGGGAGLGDGPQVLDQILPAHADAVVGDGDLPPGLVDGKPDAELRLARRQLRLGDGFVAQPVAGIGGVGDELAEKDLLVRVQRVRDDVEKAADFGLEVERLYSHGQRLIVGLCDLDSATWTLPLGLWGAARSCHSVAPDMW